jgi:adenylosuccinate synthase
MNEKLIVILTGEISSGKTSIAHQLSEKFDFKVLKTHDALRSISKKKYKKKANEDERMFLQRVGESEDRETNGSWIVDFFQTDINKSSRIAVDSLRIPEQIKAFRQSYGYQNVFQIYLEVSERELQKRYFKREGLKFDDLNDIQAYNIYKSNKTEAAVKNLADEADLIIDSENFPLEDNVIRLVSFLRLLPSIEYGNVDIIVGGQFGSEGKGQIAAYLSPEYDCLIRVGGPNAGHKVFEDSAPDTFHILPSGTRRTKNAKIILGPGSVLNLEILLDEIRRFDIQPDRLLIDENCTIITKDDIELEKTLDKIGSTTQGVGAATANNLLKNRLQHDTSNKAKNFSKLKRYINSSHICLEKLFENRSKILLEGTQGTLLSLHHGIYPYVTSRDTTVSGCLSDAGISPRRVRKIIMVTRTYPIRVQSPKEGTSGPFSRFDSNIEVSYEELAKSSGVLKEEIMKLEKTSTTNRQRRISKFNWALFREACELNSPTDIALTFTDYLDNSNRTARRYDQLTKKTTKFIDEVERCSGVPVSLMATNFNHRSIIDRRNWK